MKAEAVKIDLLPSRCSISPGIVYRSDRDESVDFPSNDDVPNCSKRHFCVKRSKSLPQIGGNRPVLGESQKERKRNRFNRGKLVILREYLLGGRRSKSHYTPDKQVSAFRPRLLSLAPIERHCRYASLPHLRACMQDRARVRASCSSQRARVCVIVALCLSKWRSMDREEKKKRGGGGEP